MSQENGKFQTSLWDDPVYVRNGSGMTETIRGPEEGLSYLLNRWPRERGKYYGLAKLACVGALVNLGSVETAREAFKAAAIEVKILA